MMRIIQLTHWKKAKIHINADDVSAILPKAAVSDEIAKGANTVVLLRSGVAYHVVELAATVLKVVQGD